MPEPIDDGHHHVWLPLTDEEEPAPTGWVCERCGARVNQPEMPAM